MKNIFFCEQCNYKFENEGIKKEWDDKMYGKCWKWISQCPRCNKECGEVFIRTSSSKKDVDFDKFVNDLKNKGLKAVLP
jgi:hypothetical protein